MDLAVELSLSSGLGIEHDSMHLLQENVYPDQTSLSLKGKRKREDGVENDLQTHKKYVCDTIGCKYTTVYSRDFKRHLRVHSNEKPFKCEHVLISGEICPYAASRLDHLKTHTRIHTGEKPYKCPVPECPYACTQISALKKHAGSHGGEKPFKCDIEGCSYEATKREYLKVHKAKTHGLETEVVPQPVVRSAERSAETDTSGVVEGDDKIIEGRKKKREHWI